MKLMETLKTSSLADLEVKKILFHVTFKDVEHLIHRNINVLKVFRWGFGRQCWITYAFQACTIF